jgi:hypothetical protein
VQVLLDVAVAVVVVLSAAVDAAAVNNIPSIVQSN